MRLLRSFRFAFEGAVCLLRTQANARIHLLAAVAVLFVGGFLGLNLIEWAVIVSCIAFVWSCEAFNTAIEKLCDRVTTDRDPQIKIVKDVSAAATLFAAIGAACAGTFVMGPKLVRIFACISE